MNMDNNPTVDQLRELIRACKDTAGHHMLWVAKNGDVHVSQIPKKATPMGVQEATPEMQLRLETFEAGNEYVGPDAAADDEWVNRLFAALIKEWPQAKGKAKPEYCDLFF